MAASDCSTAGPRGHGAAARYLRLRRRLAAPASESALAEQSGGKHLYQKEFLFTVGRP